MLQWFITRVQCSRFMNNIEPCNLREVWRYQYDMSSWLRVNPKNKLVDETLRVILHAPWLANFLIYELCQQCLEST